jgi:hypothetical protein
MTNLSIHFDCPLGTFAANDGFTTFSCLPECDAPFSGWLNYERHETCHLDSDNLLSFTCADGFVPLTNGTRGCVPDCAADHVPFDFQQHLCVDGNATLSNMEAYYNQCIINPEWDDVHGTVTSL